MGVTSAMTKKKIEENDLVHSSTNPINDPSSNKRTIGGVRISQVCLVIFLILNGIDVLNRRTVDGVS